MTPRASSGEQPTMPSNPALKYLRKKAKLGSRGYPVATVIFYGPDDRRATKVAVGLLLAPGHPTAELERWFTTDRDAHQASRGYT
jgi:hypothetical protein